jgi:serine protease Do
MEKALPFAPPSSFRVGDWAIAIGNALGLPGGPSVTLGVVGALDRTLTTREQTLTDLIQTDAAINEGNSGGPLVDLNGEIIGINTAVVQGAQGIGFSVSSFTVIPVVQSILKHGRVMWPWLGVSVQDVTAPLALELQMEERRGVLMHRIWPDSPAEAAGIQEGDVLISIDGKAIASIRALQRVMREQLTVGQEVHAQFLRDGDPLELTVVLEEMPR